MVYQRRRERLHPRQVLLLLALYDNLAVVQEERELSRGEEAVLRRQRVGDAVLDIGPGGDRVVGVLAVQRARPAQQRLLVPARLEVRVARGLVLARGRASAVGSAAALVAAAAALRDVK